MNRNQHKNVNLSMVLVFFAAVFFLGLTGCTESGKKHSIKLQEPEIFLTASKEYIKLNSFSQKMSQSPDLMLKAEDKLVFSPEDVAKGLRITTSCLISGGTARSTTLEPHTWNRSFRSEIPFLEMIPLSLLQKELKREISFGASLTCSFAITAMGDGGSTHRMDLPMVAFDIANLLEEIDLGNDLSENVSRILSSRAQTLADKVQVTFICSSGITEEFISKSATVTSERATQILADQQSASKIGWFGAQQKCRIGFLDNERILTAISNELTVQAPRRNVSVSFIHNRSFFTLGSPESFKLGTLVIRNLTNSPVVANAPQVAEGLFRYIVLTGDKRTGDFRNHGVFTDKGSVRLSPQISADHVNGDGTIDVFVGPNSDASINVFGINPQINCFLSPGVVDAIFISNLIQNSETKLLIHEIGTPQNSGFGKGAIIHTLATEKSAYSVLVSNEFNRSNVNTGYFFSNPEHIAENPRNPPGPPIVLIIFQSNKPNLKQPNFVSGRLF